MPRSPSRSGFTLIELSILLVLFSLLSAMAVPSFSNTLAHARTRARLDRLSADIFLARSHAARAGGAVSIRFQPSTGCADYYELLDDSGSVLRRVTTDRRETGVCLSSNVSRAMRVNARGMLVGSPRKFRATSGRVADSATVSMVGRVYRWR